MGKKETIKIALVGPESTGKTTLCKQLALHYKTEFIPEFARTYFQKANISDYTITEVEEIYKVQLEKEKELEQSNNLFVFCDTALISGKVWCEIVFKNTPSFIELNLSKQHYHLYLLCDIDIAWEADEQRKNKNNRKEIFEMHLQLLNEMDANFEIVSGLNETRLKNAIQIIDDFLKPKT